MERAGELEQESKVLNEEQIIGFLFWEIFRFNLDYIILYKSEYQKHVRSPHKTDSACVTDF